MSALSYILTSPPRRVCNENLQTRRHTLCKHTSLHARDSTTLAKSRWVQRTPTSVTSMLKHRFVPGRQTLSSCITRISRTGSLILPRKHRPRRKTVLIVKELQQLLFINEQIVKMCAAFFTYYKISYHIEIMYHNFYITVHI